MSQQFSIEDFHFDISISSSGVPAFEVGECNGGNYATQKKYDFPAKSTGTGLKLTIDTGTTRPSLVVDSQAALPTGNPAVSLPSDLWDTIEFWRYKDPFDDIEVFFGTEDLRACTFRVYARVVLSQSALYIAHDMASNKLLFYIPNSNAIRKVVL